MKPVLLELFERHFVPLGTRVVPCLPGLVIALLSAMEDAGSDFHSRAVRGSKSSSVLPPGRLPLARCFTASPADALLAVIASPQVLVPEMLVLDSVYIAAKITGRAR